MGYESIENLISNSQIKYGHRPVRVKMVSKQHYIELADMIAMELIYNEK